MTSAVSASPDFPAFPQEAASTSMQGLLDFSSKALHHYLLMHDKLMAEKDLRLREKEEALRRVEQDKAELEGYARILETALEQRSSRAKGAN